MTTIPDDFDEALAQARVRASLPATEPGRYEIIELPVAYAIRIDCVGNHREFAMTKLHHCPQIVPVAGSTGNPLFQGACACCGWADDRLVAEPLVALGYAYQHMSDCDESWAA